MKLIINGETKQCEAASVSALMEALGLKTSQVAVERNGAIVPRSEHHSTALAEGDAIEIVTFIGGG